MTMLWMIEDLEPWQDEPAVGDVCEPTTYWATAGAMDLPDDLMREVSARVETVTIDGRLEQIAHLGDGFTTMLPHHLPVTGEVTLKGCLVWDRYLWTDYLTQPTGRALVTDRVPLIQRAVRTPTEYPGWYGVTYEGQKKLHRGSTVPEKCDIVAYALSVTLQ